MADRGGHGWTTVGHGNLIPGFGRAWEAEQEQKEFEAIAAWDKDEQWPGM